MTIPSSKLSPLAIAFWWLKAYLICCALCVVMVFIVFLFEYQLRIQDWPIWSWLGNIEWSASSSEWNDNGSPNFMTKGR